jgi:hypothetical protein
VEDNVASPNGCQLLHYKGMGKKSFGVSSDGNLNG